MLYFKNLRIYKEKTTFELLNLFMINKLLHYAVFVNNADRIYKISCKILGNINMWIIPKLFNTLLKYFSIGSETELC